MMCIKHCIQNKEVVPLSHLKYNKHAISLGKCLGVLKKMKCNRKVKSIVWKFNEGMMGDPKSQIEGFGWDGVVCVTLHP